LIVVDASAILEVLLDPPSATEIAQRLFAMRETIHVPHLIDLEVLQALRRYARSEMTSSRAEKALQIYGDMPMKRYSHKVLMPRIWELRHNFTTYDASYIALAEALDAPLITCDRAFASTSGHRAQVLVF
jgi:predicted nucleic acid-binding protein